MTLCQILKKKHIEILANAAITSVLKLLKENAV